MGKNMGPVLMLVLMKRIDMIIFHIYIFVPMLACLWKT